MEKSQISLNSSFKSTASIPIWRLKEFDTRTSRNFSNRLNSQFLKFLTLTSMELIKGNLKLSSDVTRTQTTFESSLAIATTS